MKEKVDKLYFKFLEDGFDTWMEKIEVTVKATEKTLNDHLLTREKTCPIVQSKKLAFKDKVLIFGAFLSSVSCLAGVMMLIVKLKELTP
jgi:hypothetical protein